jgi:dihydrofolate synthase/folylpolyglutamate synthase
VITSISLDHTEILGDSIEAIAREKAGIIKAGRPVVIGFLPQEAETIIRQIALERGCQFYSARETFGNDLAHYPETILPGDYQRRNAATATLVARVIKELGQFDLSDSFISEGLKTVRWAGRWERHHLEQKDIILDATHNPEGVLELDKNLSQLRKEVGKKLVIMAGTLGEKRAEALLPVLAKHAQKLYLLMPKQPRSCSYETMRRFIPSESNIEVYNSELAELFPAPGQCSVGDTGEVLVATGSIYLIGEIFDALYHAIPVGEEDLQD